MDLLCENEFKIGLIGSMYFIGVVISTVTAPPLADAYGRKMVLFGSNIARIIGLTGLILTDSLYAVYVFEVFVGLSFAGVTIVGINYFLEYMKRDIQDILITVILIFEAVAGILMTIWYQFIDKGWFLLQLLVLIISVLCTFYFLLFVPEAPKWLYINEFFNEAREVF